MAVHARFMKDIGVAYTLPLMNTSTDFFSYGGLFNRKLLLLIGNPSLYVEDMGGVAYTSNNQIHVSARYIQSYSGVVYHEMTHVWQWSGNGQAPSGLLEGIADFVRLKAGYAPSHWVRSGQGDRWDRDSEILRLLQRAEKWVVRCFAQSQDEDGL